MVRILCLVICQIGSFVMFLCSAALLVASIGAVHWYIIVLEAIIVGLTMELVNITSSTIRRETRKRRNNGV